MTSFPITGLPGIKSTITTNAHQVLADERSGIYLPGGVHMSSASRDAANTEGIGWIRPGNVLGKITASGKYAPSFVGQLTADASSGATTVTVSAEAATEIVRRLGASSGTLNAYGPPTTNGTVAAVTLTVSAVNTSTGALTVSATSAALVAGSIVGFNDGSQTPLGILGGSYSIGIVDQNGTAADAFAENVLIGGTLRSTSLLPYSTNANVRAYIRTALNTNGCTFRHDQSF